MLRTLSLRPAQPQTINDPLSVSTELHTLDTSREQGGAPMAPGPDQWVLSLRLPFLLWRLGQSPENRPQQMHLGTTVLRGPHPGVGPARVGWWERPSIEAQSWQNRRWGCWRLRVPEGLTSSWHLVGGWLRET